MVFLDKFIELVGRSKLIEEDQLSRAIVDWKSRATLRQLADAQSCADHLVSLGLLTEWQCAKLLDGRHRGFFLGRYKLLDHLGSGGMSSVYLAEHVLMQRRVAIKVLPHNRVGDSLYLARFHFEAQAAAALDHRNIVRAYDLDNEGRIHYLVMEYIEGRDLDAIVTQDGPLDYYTAANVIAQAAAGLDHAHHCSLVHRDIKPANLLVDLKGTVKILDMGLAKFINGSRSTPGAQDAQILGTADYLAPEQAINSQTVDHRVDIYALGCTLYFLLTGHPPFADGTSMERMTAHRHLTPPSVLLDRPDAPEALVAICRRMMEKLPGDRYQSANEVQQALDAWLESQRASGKINPAALTVAGRASSRGRHHSKSKANLVSGSASDLNPPPPDSPQFPSSLQDTSSNLSRATEKICSELATSRSEPSTASPPGSEVLSTGAVRPAGSNPFLGADSPAPPPIISPPRETPSAAHLQPSEPSLAPTIAPATQCSSIDLPTPSNPNDALAQHAGDASRLVSWIWASVLIGLITVATAFVIFALSR
jgi:serine/threonine-protein kinase